MLQCRVIRRPAADYLGTRLEHAQGGSDAGNHPATADGDKHRVQVGCLLEQLHADGALAGNDLQVVVGGHERYTLRLGLPACLQLCT
ncbi:hypothetical protein D3C72_2003360 [compost metagenome]